jgi:hypothetical protein
MLQHSSKYQIGEKNKYQEEKPSHQQRNNDSGQQEK